jgi:alkaline phosphatase D
MKRIIFPGVFLLLTIGLSCTHRDSANHVQSPPVFDSDLVIAFGSCDNQDLDQNFWNRILDHEPDLWIWLGDNIYGDTENMEEMASKYAKLDSNVHYRNFRQSCQVIGTWDDHDYGVNDGGKEYPMKDQSKKLLLEFLEVPPDHAVWDRRGVYQEYEFSMDDHQILVLLLDTRYFRDPIEKAAGVYQPNDTGTILGEEQWDWLEATLDTSDADLVFIGSGIQVLPEDHRFEKWANFPAERRRLIEVIRGTEGKEVILLSGDRHISEVSRIKLGGQKWLWEVTSSSLTHAWGGVGEEPNQHRTGELIKQNNFAILKVSFAGEIPELRLEFWSDGGELLASTDLNDQ